MYNSSTAVLILTVATEDTPQLPLAGNPSLTTVFGGIQDDIFFICLTVPEVTLGDTVQTWLAAVIAVIVTIIAILRCYLALTVRKKVPSSATKELQVDGKE